MFLVIAFSIILAQGIALQLIAIQYIQGYVGPRSERASDELSVLRDLNNLITPHAGTDHASYVRKICKKLFLRKKDNIFDDIQAGNCDEEEIRGYAAIIWSTIAGTKDRLELSDITHRLQALNHDPDHGEDLFMLLDEGCDGRVTRDELEKLVVNTASMLKKRAAAMRGIQLLLRKLELLLTIFVFGTIVFIYSESINVFLLAPYQEPVLMPRSNFLPAKVGQRRRSPLDRYCCPIFRLLRARCRSGQLLRLRLRQTSLRHWRSRLRQEPEVGGEASLLNTYQLRGGRR